MNRKISQLIILIFSATLLTAFNYKGYNQHLKIKTSQDNQINNFVINVVGSEQEKERGLMWVTDLPEKYGMLFEFQDEQMVYMWMKNTKIPLDMLFIDKNNKIINIKHNAKPESLDVISSVKPVAKVLEINGGLADKLGIKVEDEIQL